MKASEKNLSSLRADQQRIFQILTTPAKAPSKEPIASTSSLKSDAIPSTSATDFVSSTSSIETESLIHPDGTSSPKARAASITSNEATPSTSERECRGFSYLLNLNNNSKSAAVKQKLITSPGQIVNLDLTSETDAATVNTSQKRMKTGKQLFSYVESCDFVRVHKHVHVLILSR